MNLRSTKVNVLRLITDFPHLKDSDYKLIVALWSHEIPYECMSGREVLHAISMGQVTNPECIRRCRQLLNQSDPSTRGLSYKKRQTRAEEIKNEIVSQAYHKDTGGYTP